jgi:hypothetical protein
MKTCASSASESAQHHKEDGKRATEGVDDAAAAKKAKSSTLSTDQQSFVSKFNPDPAKIDKERKLQHVMSRVASTVSRSKVHD